MTNFPSCPLPSSVTGVVNIPAWDAKITELLGSEQVNKGLVDLMLKVRHQLSEGADSHVSSPGTTLTQGTNWISEEARADKAYAKVADALASFTRSGHIAGPILDQDCAQYKVNPILAVKSLEGMSG